MSILGDIIESLAIVVETINGTLPAPGEQEEELQPITDGCRAPEAVNWDAHELPSAEYPK